MKEFGKIKERYDFSVDARQLGLVFFGMAALLALIFVLGVSVGLQWEKRKKAESAPPAPAVARQAVKPAAVPAVPVAPPVLRPVTTVPPPQPPQKAEKQPSDELTFPKVLTSNTKKTAPLKEKDKRAEKGQAAARFTVQLGAYESEEAAGAAAAKLKKRGYSAHVYTDEAAKGRYKYKVRVGIFESREKAAAMSKKLKESEKASAFVTKEE